jgi:hypothetical protein
MLVPQTSSRQTHAAENKNTKRTRVKRHQPVYFSCKDLLRLTPLLILVELAEGIEPPTL